MKIQTLRISNFRGIRAVELIDLGGVVVIAGQNGSGKSCIFDAIRLIKSVYGGYQQNEWAQWMGEFQIALTNSSADFRTIFNDPRLTLNIECEFCLSESERAYINANMTDLVRERVLRALIPEAYGWGANMAAFSAQVREREADIAQRMEVEEAQVAQELRDSIVTGRFTIAPGELPKIKNSAILSIVFSIFRPTEIGVIDYHGAQRFFGRENVQGINLNLNTPELQSQRSQAALYNYSAKYNNVKSEMASSFVKELLAERAGNVSASSETLTSTLQELFATFFPHKVFLGPQPTALGALSFPVQGADGSQHDLDDLSAGEKEILYGYLRIRNSAPCNSIILLDEPELHLNPRLVRGLPEFYRKNLGERLNNQLWLVTHSDALLREVVGRPGYNAFHMSPSSSLPASASQIRSLDASNDLRAALLELVGDIAAFRPNAKVVIVEGGGSSEFDSRVLTSLFPALGEAVNLISGENKTRVRALLNLLDKASANGVLPYEFCCITDRDLESASAGKSGGYGKQYQWDAYHIENYLLAAERICGVLNDIGRTEFTVSSVNDALMSAAVAVVPEVLRDELMAWSNRELVQKLDVGFNPNTTKIGLDLASAIDRSFDRVLSLRAGTLSDANIEAQVGTLTLRYQACFGDGSWRKVLPGRSILKRLCYDLQLKIPYEVFRNLILAKMIACGDKPEGMKIVVDEILLP
jgi:predicted ATPase